MFRGRVMSFLIVVGCLGWPLLAPHGTQRVRAENVTPSPGPIATVMPMPCPAGFQPTSIKIASSSGPASRTVRRKATLHRLYQALCSMPPISQQQTQCPPVPNTRIYTVDIDSGRQIVLALTLFLGTCRQATIGYHGYIATYRVPDSTVRLVAHILGVPASQLPGAAGISCRAGVTFTLHPGLPAGLNAHLRIAPDIPRGPFRVSVPLYPVATRLTKLVGKPVPQYPADPYLQTAVAEYQTPTAESTVMGWYKSAFKVCGWRSSGSMSTNSNVLNSGLFFQPAVNRNLEVDMTFGHAPSGGTYIAYAVEEITYPKRPARSYLHGPFRQVRIALRHNPINQKPAYTVHVVIRDHAVVARIVSAINSVAGYHTVSGTCAGGFLRVSPAWLTFIRLNGSKAHAYEEGPGVCLGLAVNGVRWLIDPGQVWNLIRKDVRIAQGRG